MRHALRALTAGLLAAGLTAFALSCGTKQTATQSAAISDSAAAAPTPVVNQRGQQAFLAYCAMCHGESGAGDGPMAPTLANQKVAVPAHLNDRARLDQIGRGGVYAVIEKGGAHTGRSNLMPAWGEKLSPALIDSITDFVMTLPDIAPAATATIAKYLAAPPGVSAEGRKLFVYYCSGCHGPYGRGDGFNAEVLRVKHNVRPRDLTDSLYFAPKTDQRLYETIALGGGHVGKSVFMPAWTFTLNPTQIKDLVAYIRVLSHTTPS